MNTDAGKPLMLNQDVTKLIDFNVNFQHPSGSGLNEMITPFLF